MADAKMIESRVDNGIALLEINRPPVNSYTTELLKELDAAILDARFNDDVHGRGIGVGTKPFDIRCGFEVDVELVGPCRYNEQKDRRE